MSVFIGWFTFRLIILGFIDTEENLEKLCDQYLRDLTHFMAGSSLFYALKMRQAAGNCGFFCNSYAISRSFLQLTLLFIKGSLSI